MTKTENKRIDMQNSNFEAAQTGAGRVPERADRLWTSRYVILMASVV